MQKFGKTESEIVAMGHDAFVSWYCTPERAGKDAKIQAETVFGVALNECNAPKLKALDKQNQLFFESAISHFADLAKTAFSTGIYGSQKPDAWALTIAKTNTAIQFATYELLTPSIEVEEPKTIGIERMCKTAYDRAAKNHPELKNEGNRLLGLYQKAEQLFNSRPQREQFIAKNFAILMVHVAVSGPDMS